MKKISYEKIINLLLIFPVIIIEKLFKKTNRYLYFVLPLLALIGFYDIIFWPLLSPLTDVAISFSNKSLISIGSLLIAMNLGEWLGSVLKFVPGLGGFISILEAFSSMLEQFRELIEKGTLVVGLQSAVLYLGKSTLLTKLFLGLGFLMWTLPIKKISYYGRKFIIFGFTLIFILPIVVTCESVIFEYVSNNIESSIETNKEIIWDKSKEFASKGLTFRDTSGILDVIKSSFGVLTQSIMFAVLWTLTMIVIVPYVAYLLIFKLTKFLESNNKILNTFHLDNNHVDSSDTNSPGSSAG